MNHEAEDPRQGTLPECEDFLKEKTAYRKHKEIEAIKAVARIEGYLLTLPSNALKDTPVTNEIKTLMEYLMEQYHD